MQYILWSIVSIRQQIKGRYNTVYFYSYVMYYKFNIMETINQRIRTECACHV